MSEADSDVLFGQLAVKRGLIASEELEEALALQSKLRESGNEKPVGELLIELGYLTKKQAHRLLRDQQEKTGATKTIGNFEVLAKLGEGGMGAVYLAKMIGPAVRGGVTSGPPEEIEEGPLVALKILPPRLARDEALLMRFRREVEVLSGLQHPNVVRAVDWGKADGLHFLAMEFVQGENAYQKVDRDGPMPERTVAEISLEVARALEYAHEKGMIHRDIKPENILIDLSNVAHLTDFGLVSLQDDAENASLTRVGLTVGTPYYISPEQAQGDRKVDARSDLYSLGATMFHLLTGDVPYEGEDAPVIMTKHIVDPIPDPRDHNPRVSPQMSAVVMKLMGKSPKDRYRNASDLAEDLKRILRGAKPVFAHVRKARPSVPAPRRVTATRTRLSAPVNRKRKSGAHAAVVVAAALALLAGGLGLGIHLGREEGQNQRYSGHTDRLPPAITSSGSLSQSTEPAEADDNNREHVQQILNLQSRRSLAHGNLKIVNIEGRKAVQLPPHNSNGVLNYRLLMVDEKGLVKKPQIHSELCIDYAATGISRVNVVMLGGVGERGLQHRTIRRPIRSTGSWERLSLPFSSIGVIPGETIKDITMFFEPVAGNAVVFVSDVSIRTEKRARQTVLFDIEAQDVVPVEGWSRRREGIFCSQYGSSLNVTYSTPEAHALLVLALLGEKPSTAVLEIGEVEYQIDMPMNDKGGRIAVLPFHGPREGSLTIRLYPGHGQQMGFYRATLYRLP